MTVRPQDLGGRLGFGPVEPETDEPVYHAAWEGVVVAGILATISAGLYNVDQFRAAIDDLDPLSYLSVGYYGRWLHTLELNCERAGVFSPEEVEARLQEIAAAPEAPLPDRADPALSERLRLLIADGASNARPLAAAPAYTAGQRVRGRRFPGERHVRIPGYAQGAGGVVERVHEAFVFPDTNRRGAGEQPQYVYAVRFEARDLWPDAEPGSCVVVDLWESYLEAA